MECMEWESVCVWSVCVLHTLIELSEVRCIRVM